MEELIFEALLESAKEDETLGKYSYLVKNMGYDDLVGVYIQSIDDHEVFIKRLAAKLVGKGVQLPEDTRYASEDNAQYVMHYGSGTERFGTSDGRLFEHLEAAERNVAESKLDTLIKHYTYKP